MLESEIESHVADEPAAGEDHRDAINIPTLVASTDLHRPIAIVLVAMLVQQASGINAGVLETTCLVRSSNPVASHVLQQRYSLACCT